MKKKKDTPADKANAEEVTDGIQKLVQGNTQEPIVLDQVEDDEPQGPEEGDTVEEEAAPETEVVEAEVVEAEVVEAEVVEAEVAQLSRPPFQERARQEQQPAHMADPLKDAIFKKHSNRGQLAVGFANAILGAQGMKSNSEQVVKRSFEVADGIQAEIDRCYNEEMTRRITGQQ